MRYPTFIHCYCTSEEITFKSLCAVYYFDLFLVCLCLMSLLNSSVELAVGSLCLMSNHLPLVRELIVQKCI